MPLLVRTQPSCWSSNAKNGIQAPCSKWPNVVPTWTAANINSVVARHVHLEGGLFRLQTRQWHPSLITHTRHKIPRTRVHAADVFCRAHCKHAGERAPCATWISGQRYPGMQTPAQLQQPMLQRSCVCASGRA